MFKLSLAISAAAVQMASTADAASLTGSSPGFHYFYKQRATMAEHDSAVADCSVRLRAMVNGSDAMGEVTAATGGGLLGAIIGGVIDSNENRQGDAANMEGCMALKGWSVVALTEEEGRSMEQPDDPPTIHEKLRPYVEASSPRGAVLREPFSNELAVGAFKVEPAHDLEEVSISVRATKDQAEAAVDAAGPLKTPKPQPPKGVKAPKTINGIKAPELSTVDPDKAFVVFREIGRGVAVNGTTISLSRIAADGTEIVYDGVAVAASLGGSNNPKVAKSKIGDDKVYDFVAEIPEGRWKLSAFSYMQYAGDLCFGAPAFDVKMGEAVFIGTLNLREEGGYPISSDINVAKEILSPNPALAEKVKSAEWTNGFTSDCFGSYAYAYEMPGAPFIDMSALKRQAEAADAAQMIETPEVDATPADLQPEASGDEQDTISSGDDVAQ